MLEIHLKRAQIYILKKKHWNLTGYNFSMRDNMQSVWSFNFYELVKH